MTEPLYKALTEAGRYEQDLTEGWATQMELEDFMDIIHDYDIVADPDNERYLLQDDQHQYSVTINQMKPDEGQVVVSANDEGFAKEYLEDGTVLGDEDFTTDPRDEAIFDDGSDALFGASERADKHTPGHEI